MKVLLRQKNLKHGRGTLTSHVLPAVPRFRLVEKPEKRLSKGANLHMSVDGVMTRPCPPIHHKGFGTQAWGLGLHARPLPIPPITSTNPCWEEPP
eukprot:CAMPEP_0196588924 /NCGR_PEP_ID=MMETSP1081-20130531/62104_1 /TAXON_ID=36882 /ORGANISM="Pyramimonas amylifera, Strain CCMP720" /LENGTH=94 /DNA_ID=CAMNT_0041911569 /DNA_START=104 /DNA_END=388 /DNA_ORIENTATION=+